MSHASHDVRKAEVIALVPAAQHSKTILDYPHWRTYPWTWAARVALQRVAVSAPGGVPEILNKVVDGKIIAIAPPATAAQGGNGRAASGQP
ncbi:hypothetical protein [Streptomyces sp. NPDC001194]